MAAHRPLRVLNTGENYDMKKGVGTVMCGGRAGRVAARRGSLQKSEGVRRWCNHLTVREGTPLFNLPGEEVMKRSASRLDSRRRKSRLRLPPPTPPLSSPAGEPNRSSCPVVTLRGDPCACVWLSTASKLASRRRKSVVSRDFVLVTPAGAVGSPMSTLPLRRPCFVMSARATSFAPPLVPNECRGEVGSINCMNLFNETRSVESYVVSFLRASRPRRKAPNCG